ncbi:hypothetical protein PROFUN_13523 [Planoprotostelium fungivorum]|uniref:Uncharacterized protein n=1 Tax=Planoprotostelium fungivorum TaxID=1890364 RepID=A0A2P6N3G9_9EUKA|nr:hypothetical protein PROFUN_13523 [Planoprotostelium fungivorum]
MLRPMLSCVRSIRWIEVEICVPDSGKLGVWLENEENTVKIRHNVTIMADLLKPENQNSTQVKFSVAAHTFRNEKIHLIGSCEELGNWKTEHSIPLSFSKLRSHKREDGSRCGIWQATVTLDSDKNLEYKYIMKPEQDSAESITFEAIKTNRTVQTSGYGMVVDDGHFGCLEKDTEFKEPEQNVLVDAGWLINQVQLRVYFGKQDPETKFYRGVTLQDPALKPSELDIKIVPEGKLHLSETQYYKSVGLADDRTFVMTAPDRANLSFIVYIVRRSNGKKVGSLNLQHYELGMRGLISRPILNKKGKSIARVDLQYLVVDPFNHPGNTLASVGSNPFPDLIGHRGMGISGKAGALINQTVTENTLLSFVTAAKLGAEFIEFDVQLTSDGIPIITHDEEIWVRTLDSHDGNPQILRVGQFCETILNSRQVPINKLKYSKIKRLKPLILEEEVEGKPEVTQQDKRRTKLKRASSIGEFQRGRTYLEMSPVAQPNSHNKEPNYWDTLASFPSLEEVLRFVPKEVGFNVEIKYPDNAERERYFDVKERNVYVNTILRVIFDHANDRKLMISSFDPDVCQLCAIKQIRFPVFFLTEGGTIKTDDGRKDSVRAAIQFAKSARLVGIVSDSTPILEDLSLIKEAHDVNLMMFTYGHKNSDINNVRKQKKAGVDSVICDNVARVKKEGRHINMIETVMNPYVHKFLRMRGSVDERDE